MNCLKCGRGEVDHLFPPQFVCIDRGGKGVVLSPVDCLCIFVISTTWAYALVHGIMWALS